MKVSTRTLMASFMACQAITSKKTSTQDRKPALIKRWLFVLMLFITAGASAQNVNVTGALVGNGTYPTLAAAFTAISVAGNNGSPAIGVSIVANTTETTTATLGAFTWASVNVTATTSVLVSGSIVGAIIKLNGADNVTIDGRIAGTGRNITVSNTSNTTATAAVWISSVGLGAGATNNTVRNCNLSCGADQSAGTLVTFGVIVSGTAISLTSAGGDDNDNNSIIDNSIIKCRYGIFLRGVSATNFNQTTIVTDNLIGPASFGSTQIGKVGINCLFQNNCTIERNEIRFVGLLEAQVSNTGADRVGIALGSESWSASASTVGTNTNFVVRSNSIHDIVDEQTFSAVGIIVATTNGGSPTSNIICSNMLYNIRANATSGDQTVGIGYTGGFSDQVVYNSIYLTGDVDPAAAGLATQFSSGIRISNANTGSHANLTLKNNAVYMDLSSSTSALRFDCISGNSAAYSFGTGGEDYNAFYVNPSNPQCIIGSLGTVSANANTTSFLTLAAWKLAYTVNQDANSIQADPGFVSTTDLHINTVSSTVSNNGTVVGCTIDFDGTTRSATPDIGADEYVAVPPPAIDAGVIGVTALPASPQLCSGTPVNLTATVKNFGTTTQNAIPVYYKVNGGPAVGPVNTVGPILTNGTENVVFNGANAFTPPTGGTYTIKVFTQLGSDATAANDTTTITYVVGNKIAAFPYIEPFTTAPGWTVFTEVVAGTTPIWGLATATAGPDGVASNVAGKANFFNASAGRIERLQSPVMDFTSLTSPVVHYYVSHRTFTGGEDDGLEMVISTDCGQTFSTLVPTKFNTSTPSLSTLSPLGTSYVPSAAGNWRHESIDLSAYAGQSSVIIGFRALSDFGNSLWLDNFIVSDASAVCTDAVAATGTYSCAATTSINMTSTGAPAGGDLRVTSYAGTAPNATFAANATATTQDGSIYTPDQVKTGKWYKVTYTGNDFNGYATYDISIDVTGYTPAANPNKLYIMKRADQLSPWTAITTTASGNILTASGLTTFSEFAIGGVACITPSTPSITSPICAGSTSVSGGSGEANGTTIEVFVNAISVGTTTVTANAWTKSGLTLNAGNNVTATASTGPGCTSALAGPVPVTANSTLTLTSGAGTDGQTVCINTAITDITYAIGGSATGATLSAGALPAGVNASFSAGTFTISGTPTVSGNFSYSVSTTGGGCTQTTLNGTITVNPAATITLTSGVGTNNQTVCNNASITNITYGVGNGGTGAGATGLPAGVSGSFSAGTFTISGTPTAGAGIYNYIVSTTGGCGTATANGSITVNGVLGGTFTKTNKTSCNNTNDGTINVTPSGGSGSYTYSWTGNTGVGGNTPFTAGNVSSLTGLDIGFYNVTITDAGGCGSTMITNIHIEYAYAVYVTNSGSNSSTCGNTGSILLYGNAGVKPYTYALSPGSNQPTPAPGAFQASNSFTGLAAGDYTGFIKDAGGCVSAKNVTVGAAPAIVVSPYATGASSCAPDGSVQIFRTGGTPPYTYALSVGAGPAGTFQASNTFTGLAAGPYTAYVKDAAGCTGSQTTTVAAGTGVSATISKVNTSSCVFDGSIQVNATGGVAPYTYSFSAAPYQASNSKGNLAAGNYTVQVKDSKGCLSPVYNVTINVNNINVTATPTAASSCASSNGKIQLFRTGGYGPYTYSIDGNNYFSSSIFTGLTPGTYDGYVKDSKTCLGVLNGIVVGPSCPRPAAGNTKINAVKVSVNNVITAEAYPNPSNTEFTLVLKSNSKEKVAIIVTDIMGRKVYQAEGTAGKSYRFGNSFNAGIYMVQVMQGTNTQSIKLIKE
ncbi:MAG: T9SS type A sorting domain-containing protein [Ferruginibacter sp.]